AVGRETRRPAIAAGDDDERAGLYDREVIGRVRHLAHRIAHPRRLFGIHPGSATAAIGAAAEPAARAATASAVSAPASAAATVVATIAWSRGVATVRTSIAEIVVHRPRADQRGGCRRWRLQRD